MPIGTTQSTSLPYRGSPRSAGIVLPAQRDVIDADRIEAALELVAILMDENVAYLPIFQRLEAELETTRVSSSALARARALAQKARALTGHIR